MLSKLLGIVPVRPGFGTFRRPTVTDRCHTATDERPTHSGSRPTATNDRPTSTGHRPKASDSRPMSSRQRVVASRQRIEPSSQQIEASRQRIERSSQRIEPSSQRIEPSSQRVEPLAPVGTPNLSSYCVSFIVNPGQSAAKYLRFPKSTRIPTECKAKLIATHTAGVLCLSFSMNVKRPPLRRPPKVKLG